MKFIYMLAFSSAIEKNGVLICGITWVDKHHSEAEKKGTEGSVLYNCFHMKCPEYTNQESVNRLKVATGYRTKEREVT